MKRRKNLAAAVLAVSMLLSNFGGTVGAVEPSIIHAAEQPAFTPLAQENSVAYERHQEGYQVSLDREKDSVTMLLSPVPQSDAQRTAEKAMLVIHTGAVLQPGVSYRVSFTLLADFAQPEYQVCFDGLTENAFGQPETRQLPNGGEDRFRTILTPEAGSGELVLRLLVGKTGPYGNRLRLKDLAVEAASQTELEAGTDLTLVDSLNFTAPGSVTMWANEDSKATLVSGDGQATLTVIQPPADGAVWKIKLLVATGLRPQAGKTYRLKANIQATKQAMYEVCYNEGDVEKGYGVLYEQQFTGNVQTLEKAIYIPRNKDNAGEIVLQLSLGKLPAGESVTISNITLEEGIPTYSNALPSDFSFEKERSYSYSGMSEVGTTLLPINFNYDGKAAATSSGDNAGILNLLGGAVELEVKGGTEVWHARLNIDTGMDLTADRVYRISFKARSAQPMTNYEILYGTGLNGVDNNAAYGSQKGLTHPGSNAAEEITYMVQPQADGPLMVSFQVGNSGGQQNVFTVSDILVEEMNSTATPGEDIATVNYPGGEAALSADSSPGSFRVRDNKGTLSGDGTYASITLPAPEGSREKWQRGLFLDDIASLASGVTYQVSFTVTATDSTTFDVSFNKDEDWGAAEGAYGKLEDLVATSSPSTVSYTIENAAAGKLRPRIDLGLADEGTVVTISQVQVQADVNLADVTYPTAVGGDTGTPGSFRVRDDKGTLTGDGTYATITLPAPEGSREAWQRGLFLDDIATLTEGADYQVSFEVTASNDTTFNVSYNKDEDWGAGEGAYGSQYDLTASTTVTYTIENAAAGKLRPRLDLGLADEDTQITISDILVQELNDLTSVTYPTDSSSLGSFRVRDEKGSVDGDGTYATITLPAPEGSREAWQRGLFIDDIATLTEGKEYQVSFDVWATNDTTFNVSYNKDEDWGAGEGAYGNQYDLTATSTPTTVTYMVNAASDGMLRPRIDLGLADEGTQFTVSHFRVVSPEEITSVDYPTLSGAGDPVVTPGSFRVRDDKGTLSGDGNGASITLPAPEGSREAWQRGLFIDDIATLTEGKEYQVSFDITASNDTSFNVSYNRDEDWGAGEGAYGSQSGLTAGTTPTTVTYTVNAAATGTLRPRLDLGLADEGTVVTVSNLQVKAANLAELSYPTEGSDTPAPTPTPAGGSAFRARDEKGVIDGDGTSATITLPAPEASRETWQRGLFIDDIATLNAGSGYLVSFQISASKDTTFDIGYNKDEDWGAGENAYGQQFGLTATSAPSTVQFTVNAASGGKLRLRIDLGLADGGTVVTVSGITVQEITYGVKSSTQVNDFASVWGDINSEYKGSLTKYADRATLAITDLSGASERTDWKAKLYLNTGVKPQPGVRYRLSFKFQAEKAQDKFHILYGYGGGDTEKAYAEWWNVSIQPGVPVTLTKEITGRESAGGPITVLLLLGLVDKTDNAFTISDVRLEELILEETTSISTDKDDSAARANLQEGYQADVSVDKNSATLNINRTPASGLEAWKNKFFLNPGVRATKGASYRVTLDLTADKDMDFEICYNANRTEKGYDAIYGLHAVAGKPLTVERVFTADVTSDLVIQLSLGNVPAPNRVKVTNLQVEKIDYTYTGQSAFPTPLRFTGGSAVSNWTHQDYATQITGTDKAVTVNILSAPELGAEPWKIKLFLDTGKPLQAGTNYRVTADLLAQADQNVEICYNNGGVEMGYDSQGGIHLSAGATQRVEKLISVPADKTDLNDLMLQVNLGGTTRANAVTVSGVRVEQVPVSYNELMDPNFAYVPGQSVNLWTNPDYTASLNSVSNAASLKVSGVPGIAQEVWKVQLRVHTGVTLTPGRSYQVRASLNATRSQGYEVCFNNEETEKGYDVLYGQYIQGGVPALVDKKITVPASMTDAGELILQFSVGGPVQNDFTVTGVSVQEMDAGEAVGNTSVPATALSFSLPDALTLTREGLSCRFPANQYGSLRVTGANLRTADRYAVAFTAKADKPLSGAFALVERSSQTPVIFDQFTLTQAPATFLFTTPQPLTASGAYDLVWGGTAGEDANVELSEVSVFVPAEELWVMPSLQKMTVNGETVTPAAYAVSGYNYVKLRDMALLLNGTQAQFVVRYNAQTDTVSVTTGKEYTPIGGELTAGADYSATCARSVQRVTVNGQEVRLKAFAIGGNNYFRIRDLAEAVGFQVDYDALTDTVVVTSPATPERQEAGHDYSLFFRPEIDGQSQPYVGDTMPFYEDGTFYIYYLKEGGDSYNHSVYVTTTTDFVHYTELDDPVLSASRQDVQDSWIGTGSVVKAQDEYYFFYTGFNSSGSQEYHEKIMVAKGSSPTSFQKVSGWDITPPAELNQKNDFRDPMAYYDPATDTFSLTVTASQGGLARVLKYTVSRDLQKVVYDGIIFTDPTGSFWNLECTDTFRLGDKWYLTYSGQEDTLWYASADSPFGPYSDAKRLDGKAFYAAKHVEDGQNSYMVGWVRRSTSPSSLTEIAGWGGNLAVQQLSQAPDGSLLLVPVENYLSAFQTPVALNADQVSLTADGYRSTPAFTCKDSFLLKGKFTCPASGSFGLAFDFNGQEEQSKLISVIPGENKLRLSFSKGATPIAETRCELVPGGEYSFTYVQDGSVGIFYLDGQAALTVRLYGTTGKDIRLFSENAGVTFTALEQFTR